MFSEIPEVVQDPLKKVNRRRRGDVPEMIRYLERALGLYFRNVEQSSASLVVCD